MSIMLVSTEDVKLFLGLKTEDEHDDLIELIIEQVSARIETYLNRELKAEERTKYFDAGKNSYSLPAYPVDTGETFTVNHDDVELTIDEDYDAVVPGFDVKRMVREATPMLLNVRP